MITLDTILTIIPRGKLSRDAKSVILSYGANGYLRISPRECRLNGQEKLSVRIQGHLERGNGGTQASLRDTFAAAGVYAK